MIQPLDFWFSLNWTVDWNTNEPIDEELVHDFNDKKSIAKLDQVVNLLEIGLIQMKLMRKIVDVNTTTTTFLLAAL